MKKLFLCIVMSSFFCTVESLSIIKPKTVRVRQTGCIKQDIGKEFEQLLDTSLSLISSVTERIGVLHQKVKALVSGEDLFFSKTKATQLECYKKEVTRIRQSLEKIESLIQKETDALDKNFGIVVKK